MASIINVDVVGADPRQLHDTLLVVVKLSKKSFVTMGKLLRELRENEKFKGAVGSGADTWEEYLKQPEIGLNAGEANRLIQIYEELVLRLGYDEETVAEIPVKNAHYLLPMVKKLKNKDEADEIVADATFMSQKDFKDRVYDKKAAELGVSGSVRYEYIVMRKLVETGKIEKVHGISSEQIIEAFGLPQHEQI